MVRKLLHTLLLLLVCGLTFAQTSLTGSVTDSETGEPILYGNVKLYKNGVFKLGVQTDYDGNYSAANIDPGKYDVEASYVGYKAQTVTGVIVNAGKANKLDIKITSAAVTIDVVTITEYKIPLIQQDNTSQGGAITSEQIRNLPTRNISALASTVAGLTQADEGSAITVRGARSDGTDYYIDGMRVNSSSIPDSEIDQLQVISGGLDASYGDATGGVISITTKGPSSKFSGGIEGETSQFLTPYGNHLIGANLSGPIIKKKSTGQSILGFRVSGRYTYNKDDDPPATPVYVATDAKIAEIEQNPTRRLGSVSYPSADWLKNVGDDGATGVDVWRMKYRPDEEFSSLDLVGKLDFRPVDNIDFSVGGQYRQSKDKFTPSRWRLLNHYNNPTENRENYRINVRFRHRLGNETVVEGTDASKAKSPIIRNLSYTLQASYEKNTDSRSDKRHGENFWNYGYIGQIGYQWNPIFNRVEDTLGNVSYVHIDNRQDFTGYTGDPNINPILAAYNGTDVANDAFIFNKNGIENSSYSRTWSNLHRNVGAVYDLNSKNETDLITFNGSVNFEIAPKGSKRGVHSIQAGVLWEQRTERSYTLRPYELWYLAGLIVNNHIQGVDSTKILRDTTILDPLAGEVTAHIYDNVISPDSLLADLLFYKKVREVAGVSNSQYFNINTLSPDQMRLDMFSGSELTKQSLSDDSSTPLLYYYGYDYLGNKKSGTSFNDFFTSRGANGLRDFPIAPNQPIYLAGFIQDKFTYKDIIFRLGLRVDRYDANTKVMRDPYSLYPIQTAKEFASNTGQTMPDGIGEDYKVYVDANGSNTVKAYRNGDQWYTAQGTAVNDSRSIYSSTDLVYPKYKYGKELNDIQKVGFNPDNSFEDYKPQTNFMPRLAFSFPISDAANFFAHYDILVQRPPQNTYATPLDYYYFLTRPPSNNPNLKPERTIDYEVGFQQKLTESSVLKVAAYYREMRDMIQTRTYRNLDVTQRDGGSYNTYDNRDFGTVKGFTFQYDLRRTGNVSFTLDYTLQFADGTGSNPDSQSGLSQTYDIRIPPLPLDFDERHRFVATVDYRFSEGKKYNGPRWFGLDIFSNTGANLQAIGVSGRPYSVRTRATNVGSNTTASGGELVKGALNGARKPWNFTLNLKINKNFTLVKGKNPMNADVYFRVTNLLNTLNIQEVYSVTGSPTDDGYLVTARPQALIQEYARLGRDVQAYANQYNWIMLNPNNFSLPRRMYIGAIIDF